jgi:hypothetical protein
MLVRSFGRQSVDMRCRWFIVWALVACSRSEHPTMMQHSEAQGNPGLLVLDRSVDEQSSSNNSSLNARLLTNGLQAQVKRRGKTTWGSPKKRDVLFAGDQVRTRRAQGTRLQFSKDSTLALAKATQIIFRDALVVAPASKVIRYELVSGTLNVSLLKGEKENHEVKIGTHLLLIEAGYREADVELKRQSANDAQVIVRLGRALSGDGRVVEAGQSLDLMSKRPAQLLIGTMPLILTPETHADIYYFDLRSPPLGFSWPSVGDDKVPVIIEFSRHQDFRDSLIGEIIRNKVFAYDRFEPGHHFWRVKHSSRKRWRRGSFVLRLLKNGSCIDCGVAETIEDKGADELIYFNRGAPQITIKWQPVPGARSYALKMFKEGDLENPYLQNRVHEAYLDIGKNILPVGKYLWQVSSLDHRGDPNIAGGMNSLELVRDPSFSPMRIKHPGAGTRVSASSLITTGSVKVGSTLHINNKNISLDEHGFFTTMLALTKGRNIIVYQVGFGDKLERYDVRSVYRR